MLHISKIIITIIKHIIKLQTIQYDDASANMPL